MSPKKRTKESRMKAREKKNLENRLSRVWLKAKEIGFKTPEEYMLFEELRKNDVNVRHNVHLLGTEVDIYVPPKLVIEVGFRDKYLMKKWDDFEEKGFDFLYFQNVEIHDPTLLERCVGKVMDSIHAEVNDSAHDEEEEVDPPVLKLPAEGNPDLKHLTTHEKKQFKRLRSDLNRCKQIMGNEINKLKSVHLSTPDLGEERKAEIRAHRDTVELMDKLLSHIQGGA